MIFYYAAYFCRVFDRVWCGSKGARTKWVRKMLVTRGGAAVFIQ